MIQTKFKQKEYKIKGSVVVRPSKLSTAVQCTGYLTLKDDASSSPAAQRGIRLHEESYNYVKERLKTGKKVEVTEPIVEEYGEYLLKFFKKDPEFVGMEVPLKATLLNFLVEGTCDFAYYNDGWIYIVDLKTGGQPLEKEQLFQIMMYALMFIETYSLKEVKGVYLKLYGVDQVLKKRLSLDTLLAYKNLVIKKLNKPSAFKVGSHCSKCFKFNQCVTVQTEVKNTLVNINEETDVDLTRLLEMKPLIDKFYKAIEFDIMDGHFKGDATPEGAKVIEGRRSKEWKEDAMDLTKKIKGIEVIEKNMLSPTKAIAAKLGVEEGKHWGWRPGRLKVVSEKASGQPVAPVIKAQDMFNQQIKEGKL